MCECKNRIDVGAGKGALGYILKHYQKTEHITAIEGYEPYSELCRKAGYDRVCTLTLTKGTKLPFKNSQFDVVVCSELIEHLTKAEGSALIDEMKRVGRKVIITTPNRFFANDVAIDGNSLLSHQSLWCTKELTARGFRVHGLEYFMIFGKCIKYISFLLAPLAYRFPQFGNRLFAVWTAP